MANSTRLGRLLSTLFDRIGYTYGAQYVGSVMDVTLSYSPNPYIKKVTVDHTTGHIWKASLQSTATSAIIYLDHYDPDGTFIESIPTSLSNDGEFQNLLANNNNVWCDISGNDNVGYRMIFYRANNGVTNRIRINTANGNSLFYGFYTVLCCGTDIVAFYSLYYNSMTMQHIYACAWNGSTLQQYTIQEVNVKNSNNAYGITTSDANFFDGYYFSPISQYTTNFTHVRFNMTTKTSTTNALSTSSQTIYGSGYVKNEEVYCTNGVKLGKINTDGTASIISDNFVSVGKKTADGFTAAQILNLSDQKWFIIKTEKNSDFSITDTSHKSTSVINKLSSTSPAGTSGSMVAYYNPQTHTVTMPSASSTSIIRFSLEPSVFNFSVPPYNTNYTDTRYIRT